MLPGVGRTVLHPLERVDCDEDGSRVEQVSAEPQTQRVQYTRPV